MNHIVKIWWICGIIFIKDLFGVFMNTKQIELVLDLSTTLNYRKTSEKMFISQPALSHQVKALEDELGVKLFHRSTNGVNLTPAGRIFCKEMPQILGLMQRTIASMKNCTDKFTNVINIGLNPQRSQREVSEVLNTYCREHPDIQPEIRQYIGRERMDAFKRGELDVSVFVPDGYSENIDIHMEPLYHSRLYAVCSKDDPLAEKQLVTAQDLTGYRVMLSGKNTISVLHHAQEYLQKNVMFEEIYSDSLDSTLLWIMSMGGAALVPGYCYSINPNLAWIPFDWPERLTFAIARNESDTRDYVLDFVETMKRIFKEHEDSGAIL